MSSLESIGWSAGIISAVIFVISWTIEDLNQEIKFVILAIACVIIIISCIWHRKKESQKEEKIRTKEKSTFPILSEYRTKYHDHVEGLFQEIKNNLNPLTNDQNYFDGLRKTKEKKRMILQHLRTIDALSNTYAHLFAMYNVSIAQINDAEKKKKNVYKNLIDYDEKLSSYDFGNKENEWIDWQKLKIAIGIKINDSVEDVLSNKPMYNFPSSINCNLYVVEKDGEYQLGYAGHWFAKSNDKGKLEQFKKFIYDHGHKIDQEVSNIHSTYHTVYQFGAHIFNKEFKEHDEALEGEPMLGACYTCLSWFNAENEKKYKPILDEFNSNISNYEESIWTNVKKVD